MTKPEILDHGLPIDGVSDRFSNLDIEQCRMGLAVGKCSPIDRDLVEPALLGRNHFDVGIGVEGVPGAGRKTVDTSNSPCWRAATIASGFSKRRKMIRS